MLNIKKANKLLKIAYNEFSSLQDETIFINEDTEFYVQHGFVGDTLERCSIINIVSELERNKFQSWMSRYIKKEFNIDDNVYMFYNFNEVFAFLHEVGHVYYKDMQEESLAFYESYKDNEYKSYNEMYLTYRNIPAEKLADQFASIIIKNQYLKIWSLMNEISEDQAQEEYEFWSM